MRHMTPELEEKPIERTIDDRLEMKSLSRKDRRKYKKEKLRETMEDMSKKEKFKYLLYYYKEVIIFTAIILGFGIWLGRTIYENTRPLTISYVVINCGNQFDFNLDTMEQYAKDIGKFKGCRVKGDTNVTISGKEYAEGYEGNGNSQIYINFATMATSDYYDVIFADKDGADGCAALDIYYPLDKYLDAETYAKVKDRIVTLKNMEGKDTEMVIDVSDLQFIKDLNLGYDQVYIGFPGDQKDNHDRVQDFLNYLFP
ncbi:MAG: hypothetical protein K6E27_02640 [Eubacterium sp.]|nr:hypothetical protein [Eubacterium sp.]